MQISKGQSANWSDIVNLYTKLNNERNRFGMIEVETPNKENEIALAQDLNDLRDIIIAMRSDSILGSSLGSQIDNLKIAERSSLLNIDVYNDKDILLDKMSEICPHDSPYYSSRVSYDGFRGSNDGFRSSNNGSDFSSDNSYCVRNYSFGRSSRTSGDVSYRGRGGG